MSEMEGGGRVGGWVVQALLGSRVKRDPLMFADFWFRRCSENEAKRAVR